MPAILLGLLPVARALLFGGGISALGGGLLGAVLPDSPVVPVVRQVTEQGLDAAENYLRAQDDEIHDAELALQQQEAQAERAEENSATIAFLDSRIAELEARATELEMSMPAVPQEEAEKMLCTECYINVPSP